ncbi:MAG: hypothetical protein WB996_02050 [Ignavibacteriaceae bacterium]
MKILIFILLATELCFSQQNPGAKQIALSNSDIAVSDNVFALFSNPAGLGQLKWREIGAFYSPSPFGLSELSNAYAAYSEPFGFGSIAIGAMTYGFELYRENKLALGVSYLYGDNFYLGAAINYKNVSIKKYGSKNTFIFDFGFLVILPGHLHLGFSYKNITRNSFGQNTDELPVTFQTGVSYQPINNLKVSLAVEKDIRYKASPSFGIDYRIIKNVAIRSGISTEPSKYSFGIGIFYSIINFNYAVFTHQELGLTHQADIIFSFGKK